MKKKNAGHRRSVAKRAGITQRRALGGVSVVELGCAGHFICANSCRFRRHTQLGDAYRVSTIGDYYPDHRGGKRETIGAGEDSLFETLVFETTGEQDKGNEGCGCRTVKSWLEIDGERYATAGEAQAGHERYVAQYLRLATEARTLGAGAT